MLSLAVVCEGSADRRTACDLADRVVIDSIDWITPGVLDGYRAWRGVREGDPFFAWASVRAEAEKRNIRSHGHFGGQRAEPDFHAARRALLVLHGVEPRPDAVVLARDVDDQPLRRKGLDDARGGNGRWQFEVLIGAAIPKREAWVLAAFNPVDDQERECLWSARQDIGLDPCVKSHLLDAKPDDAKTSAIRVLKLLTGGRVDRENQALADAPLSYLREKGKDNGLAEYLDEVAERLVPKFK